MARRCRSRRFPEATPTIADGRCERRIEEAPPAKHWQARTGGRLRPLFAGIGMREMKGIPVCITEHAYCSRALSPIRRGHRFRYFDIVPDVLMVFIRGSKEGSRSGAWRVSGRTPQKHAGEQAEDAHGRATSLRVTMSVA